MKCSINLSGFVERPCCGYRVLDGGASVGRLIKKFNGPLERMLFVVYKNPQNWRNGIIHAFFKQLTFTGRRLFYQIQISML